MANECSVFEMVLPRQALAPIRTVPFLAKQLLSSGSVSAAFNKSTRMVTIVSSIAGTVEFSDTANTDPSGSGDTFPIAANTPYDFDVRPNTKVRFA